MFGRDPRLRARLKNNFGKNPIDGNIYYNAENRMNKVRKYHDEINQRIDEREIKGKIIDDITWDDLEMDEVFLRVNHTNCFMGEQRLYHRLHNLSTINDDKKQSYLTENEKRRIDIEEQIVKIGKMDNDYHLCSFLLNPSYWQINYGFVFYILQVILVFFVATSVIFQSELFITGLVCIVIFNLLVYFRMKQKYEVFLDSLLRVKQIYDVAKWLIKDDERRKLFSNEKIENSIKNLNQMSKLIVGFSVEKNNALAGDVMAVLGDYLWGITLIGISTFNKVLKIIKNKQDDVWTLYDFIGDIDCEIAIASYRESQDNWCRPELRDGALEVKELVHPLLSNPVANDFVLENRAVITGANASGKSTFMKALAINVILAQTIDTCSAKHFACKPVYVMTCMSLRDDVLSGESYYFREAKYLKRMIDIISANDAVLCVIDEILKGTNTNERIAASKAIMQYIARRDCFVLVATHDMELTENNAYKKFYFDSRVEDGDIVFDYKIHSGKGGKSNAIALLELIGYPADIVSSAKANLI